LYLEGNLDSEILVKPWQRSSGEKASGLSATNIVRLKVGSRS